MDVNNSTETVEQNSTTSASILSSTTTHVYSSTDAPTTSTITTTPGLDVQSVEHSNLPLYFLSTVLFVVAVALIAKVIYNNRKRKEVIGGTARWRLSASTQSAVPLHTEAAYAPMSREQQLRNPLDVSDMAGGEQRLDWERQFFDDQDASARPQSRLQLDFNREFH